MVPVFQIWSETKSPVTLSPGSNLRLAIFLSYRKNLSFTTSFPTFTFTNEVSASLSSDHSSSSRASFQSLLHTPKRRRSTRPLRYHQHASVRG
jgi:adenosine deaminase